jgi:hypothetical protein
LDVTEANRLLLLLDLDGVVVFESEPPFLPELEILRLHAKLNPLLQGLDASVVVLTHRSRAEAARILEAAGVDLSRLAGIMAAEDLLRAGLRHGGIGGLIRWGLRKSWILPVVEERFGISRQHTAFIDDRLDNLHDLLDHGLGLALHAPSAVSLSGQSMVSFEFGSALDHIAAWREGWSGVKLISLAPKQILLSEWQRTGLHTRRQGRHVFNAVRRFGRMVRQPFRSVRAE